MNVSVNPRGRLQMNSFVALALDRIRTQEETSSRAEMAGSVAVCDMGDIGNLHRGANAQGAHGVRGTNHLVLISTQ